jgi:hypothetical protein
MVAPYTKDKYYPRYTKGDFTMTTQSKYQFASIVLILLVALLGVTYKAVMSGAMDIQQTIKAAAGTRLT